MHEIKFNRFAGIKSQRIAETENFWPKFKIMIMWVQD